MAFTRFNFESPIKEKNGYTVYNCNCCPYGYHIDLDFVRYCESISQEADRSGSIKRRKDRRRQRQSMEVLLGITPPLLTDSGQNYKPIEEMDTSQSIIMQNQQLFQDGFNDAISDFERTLQRSKNKLSHNLPDVTAVSDNVRHAPPYSSSTSPPTETTNLNLMLLPTTNDAPAIQDFDSLSIESGGTVNAVALHNIRDRMALTLTRLKKLEEEVSTIPEFKNEIAKLKEENRHLQQRLKDEQVSKLNTLNANFLNSSIHHQIRSHSNSNIDNFDFVDHDKRKDLLPPPRKDMGVMCGVLTRNIGVGHQNPHMKTVATTTTNLNKPTDKWLNDKIRFMTNDNIQSTKSTQTLTSKEKQKREVGMQTNLTPQIEKNTTNTQTYSNDPVRVNVAVQSKIPLVDFSVQKNVECYSIGCSDDTINDTICEKCNTFKISIAVGPDNTDDAHTTPINLSSLSSRSKSFNLGSDKLNFKSKTRTVACQYESKNISRYCQSESVKTQSRFCQHELKQCEKTTQSEKNSSASKNTDTKDLLPPMKHVGCETKEMKCTTKDVGCTAAVNLPSSPTCDKCSKNVEVKEKQDAQKEETKKDLLNVSTSKIPRPQIPVPIETRKFRRQDTYTKIYTSPTGKSPPSPGLSGLDLSPKAISNETNPLDKVKENLKFSECSATNSSQNGVNNTTQPITKVHIQETTLPVSETTYFQPIATQSNQNRNKAVPSKEMQGAMKVLNDSLQKHTFKNHKNDSAINIIQKEWFKISSVVAADPLDVEDYLDAFEDMSALLLEYIVNMNDTSGNTAMHYAVSHGNFDVVSILLDSKVCDINKPNNAGYTSVMLVSLAAVRSQTHANVVKRLFQLADVNIRAKQHGQTALMLAVSHGRLDMVVMLLQAGADINIQDEDGSTALMCAAEHGHTEIVKHFLSHPDCDSSITDIDGSTAIKIAMEAGHKHIGVLLYAHERNQKSYSGTKLKRAKSGSPKTPSSPLPIRSSHRALTETKK